MIGNEAKVTSRPTVIGNEAKVTIRPTLGGARDKMANSIRRTLGAESALYSLQARVQELTEAAQALHNTLEPLMTCDYPSTPGTDREHGQSEYAEKLLSESDQIDRVTNILRRMIDRL